MNKRVKADTVAFATSSGYAVVQSPSFGLCESAPESDKSRPKVTKPVSPLPVVGEPLKAR